MVSENAQAVVCQCRAKKCGEKGDEKNNEKDVVGYWKVIWIALPILTMLSQVDDVSTWRKDRRNGKIHF